MSKRREEDKNENKEVSRPKSAESERGSVLEEDSPEISTSLLMERKHRNVFSRETY